MIYLDNCATTKPRREVVDLMIKSLEEDFSNPSSLHSFGHRIEKKVEESRSIIAEFLNVMPEELYFTSGGTESNNIFINGAVKRNKQIGNKIITTHLEHSAVGEVFKNLESDGYEVVYLSSDDNGKVDLEQLRSEMNGNVSLVSIMHVNNELGTINDIRSASEIIKSANKNTFFHVDGVQAFGKIPVDLKNLGVDGYSISGHKIHAPKGIGALYIRKGIQISPIFFGGNQEKGIRSGTENTTGIFAFGKAVEILKKNFIEEDELKDKLRNQMVNLLEKNFTDYVINTPLDNSPNSILNVSFFHTRGEVILHYLEQDEIYISTTSACSSNSKTKSNLEKLGKSTEICDGSIRICLGYENTMEDIEIFMEKLHFAVEDIRKITMRKR
ncbi:MAG: cysteine desulfurase [Tissierellia bacterium]|nr:cysteine desulfurase [Tissierellia bacterium]